MVNKTLTIFPVPWFQWFHGLSGFLPYFLLSIDDDKSNIRKTTDAGYRCHHRCRPRRDTDAYTAIDVTMAARRVRDVMYHAYIRWLWFILIRSMLLNDFIVRSAACEWSQTGTPLFGTR